MMWSVTVQGTIQDVGVLATTSLNGLETFILSQIQSAEEFATKMKVLARRACDEHEWDHERCDFHLPRMCSCGKCEDEVDLKCEGKDYHTKYLLTWCYHSLAYERVPRESRNG